eukprot:SAG31_NODE_27152_length_430_cov_1.256798_1_plen_36_part_01
MRVRVQRQLRRRRLPSRQPPTNAHAHAPAMRAGNGK